MTLPNPLLVLDGSSADTLNWLQNRLSGAGLRAVQTFDLREAGAATAGCTCPHHGTAACDCQMRVLLVYDGANPPASLIMHSRDGRTWISLASSPEQPVQSAFQESIQRAIRGNSHFEGL
jgi:hypothetical protein